MKLNLSPSLNYWWDRYSDSIIALSRTSSWRIDREQCIPSVVRLKEIEAYPEGYKAITFSQVLGWLYLEEPIV